MFWGLSHGSAAAIFVKRIWPCCATVWSVQVVQRGARRSISWLTSVASCADMRWSGMSSPPGVGRGAVLGVRRASSRASEFGGQERVRRLRGCVAGVAGVCGWVVARLPLLPWGERALAASARRPRGCVVVDASRSRSSRRAAVR